MSHILPVVSFLSSCRTKEKHLKDNHLKKKKIELDLKVITKIIEVTCWHLYIFIFFLAFSIDQQLHQLSMSELYKRLQ